MVFAYPIHKQRRNGVPHQTEASFTRLAQAKPCEDALFVFKGKSMKDESHVSTLPEAPRVPEASSSVGRRAMKKPRLVRINLFRHWSGRL